MSAPPDDFLAFLEASRRDYRAELPGKLANLTALWDAARVEAHDAGSLAVLERAAHSLAGSAGTFGLAEVGAAGKVLEGALQRLAQADGAGLPAARAEVESALESVGRSIGASLG